MNAVADAPRARPAEEGERLVVGVEHHLPGLARISAEEAIARIAQLYAVEKQARGSPPDVRVELRRAHVAPVFDDLEAWRALQLTTISGKSPLAAAIRHALTHLERLRPHLDNGIPELDNNAAERGMRTIALGRGNYLFAGSEAGGTAAALAHTLIETARLNAVDPHAWLADTLARIPDPKITKIDDLLPARWNSLRSGGTGTDDRAATTGEAAPRPRSTL